MQNTSFMYLIRHDAIRNTNNSKIKCISNIYIITNFHFTQHFKALYGHAFILLLWKMQNRLASIMSFNPLYGLLINKMRELYRMHKTYTKFISYPIHYSLLIAIHAMSYPKLSEKQAKESRNWSVNIFVMHQDRD